MRKHTGTERSLRILLCFWRPMQCRKAESEIERLQTLKSNLSDQLDSLLVVLHLLCPCVVPPPPEFECTFPRRRKLRTRAN